MEETIMQQRQPRKPRQLDLFSPVMPVKVSALGAQERLLPLISALLREAAGQVKEADHEDLA
ncbi:MAG: hypothetical protein DI555_23630 [Novosphingobium pentaromativorans]|uniref:Uncharacterized protein n=1 Tax=Novosphingobium pentaromativorans TaxID=205844 RepID=A0A2W5QDW2_9SPHN|nr:MAG: hypothetical protein DI555_23630 [Novosphingobium pentaromativorans]